jgi:hypothetical protein
MESAIMTDNSVVSIELSRLFLAMDKYMWLLPSLLAMD